MKKSSFAKRIKERKAQSHMRLAKTREERWIQENQNPLLVIASNSVKHEQGDEILKFAASEY